MKKKASESKTPVIETTRQYVFCADRRGSPHVAIEVCRTRCEKYASCHAGGLDEVEAPKAKAKKPKQARVPKPSALSRILAEDEP